MRIWNKLKRYLYYTLGVILLLFVGLYVYSAKTDIRYPDYSSYNSKQTGIKALYLLGEASGYNLNRYEGTARFIPDGVVLIAVQPDLIRFSDDLERKYLKEWLERGNTLFFITDKENLNKYDLQAFTGVIPKLSDKSIYSADYGVKKGRLVLVESLTAHTNVGLRDGPAGIAFIKKLDETGIKEVYFNEYYHGFGKDGVSILNLLGRTGLIIVIQLTLGLLVLLFCNARRFGKPVTVFEIIKRKENENMFALSNIYIKSRANNLVFDNYINAFKQHLSKYLGFNLQPGDEELINSAALNHVLKDMDVGVILNECSKYSSGRKMNKEQLIQLVKRIERVRKELS